jgi:hypothetical protein
LGNLNSRYLAHQTFTDLDRLDAPIHHSAAGLNSPRNPLAPKRNSAFSLVLLGARCTQFSKDAGAESAAYEYVRRAKDSSGDGKREEEEFK